MPTLSRRAQLYPANPNTSTTPSLPAGPCASSIAAARHKRHLPMIMRPGQYVQANILQANAPNAREPLKKTRGKPYNSRFPTTRRGVGVAYRARLESVCALIAYRGFESRPLRHLPISLLEPRSYGKLAARHTGAADPRAFSRPKIYRPFFKIPPPPVVTKIPCMFIFSSSSLSDAASASGSVIRPF